MPQPQIDTNAVAKAMAKRIRAAAEEVVLEGRGFVTKSASDRRSRAKAEAAAVDADLRKVGASDRAKIEKALSTELGVTTELLSVILKEASIEAMTAMGTHWMAFFGKLGI